MPTIDDIYGVMYAPEVVPPSPAVPAGRPNALAVFRSDPAALKASALAVLNLEVKPVETLEAASKLADQRAQVKLLLKNIESRRKQIVEPLKREASEVDAEARTWSDPLKKWDSDAERVLIAFQRKQAAEAARANEAAQAAIREAAQKQAEAAILGDTKAIEAAETAIMRAEAEAPAEPIKGFKTDSGTTSLRKRWRVEVIQEEEVPDTYRVVDLKKLQAAVDAGARQIPGCNIFEEESLVVRTR